MRHFFIYSFFILAIIAVFFSVDKILNAQTSTSDTNDLLQNGYVEQQVNADISPQNPLPNQQVTISLSSYGSDINNANISWSIKRSRPEEWSGS